MEYLVINGQDFSNYVSALKVGYETLVSDKSGRNANGDSFIEVINEKVKLYITLRHTTDSEMGIFLSAIEDYVVNVSFLNPRNGAIETITAYHGTAEPEYYTIQPTMVIYKPMQINFIEL